MAFDNDVYPASHTFVTANYFTGDSSAKSYAVASARRIEDKSIPAALQKAMQCVYSVCFWLWKDIPPLLKILPLGEHYATLC